MHLMNPRNLIVLAMRCEQEDGPRAPWPLNNATRDELAQWQADALTYLESTETEFHNAVSDAVSILEETRRARCS